MKRFYKYFCLPVVLLSGCLFVASCNKADEITYTGEGNIYMPSAARNTSYALILADTAQPLPFSAGYGGLNYPSQDITVSFSIDSSLVSSYNAAYGTNYTMMPVSAFTLSATSATIKSGQTSSEVVNVQVITNSLDKALKYIIPVSITSVSAGRIDSVLKTTYFKIDAIQRLEKDITSQATLSASRDNSGGSGAGEGSAKLVDGDYNSKFLTDGFPQDFWVNLTFPSAQVIGAYTITSGNDAPERDMKDWNLAGSNDGTTWTIIDTRTGESFDGRNQTKRYEFDNTTAYKQYRINVLANNGSNLIQVSEWRLITYP